MFNLILDRLPTEYEGYLIRTDFRIGIQISLCMKDESLTDQEKMAVALSLLYGNGVPDGETAINGLVWFLACGNQDAKKRGNDKELFYWDFDNSRIYSSFMVSYGIDLTKEKMHWFKFISLLGSLTKDCSLSQAVQIRDYDMRDLKGKAKTEMERLRRDLTPEKQFSDDEKEVMAEFDAIFNGGDLDVGTN